MNKIYRLKYDRRRNQLVAVSELTTGAGKETTGQAGVPADAGTFRKFTGTLTPLAFLTGLVMSFLPGMALANADLPTGGQIVAGQGSISTNGNQMTISQNTHGLVTNWNTFDVGQNHTVQFVQPDSSAVALNRVTGGHESQILGALTANGQVMLVNPAGVMFGKGAKVNTAGLLASTKNISNADFMAGHYTFSGGSQSGAEVVNQGNLTTTKGGYIVLAADRVKNSGDISTPGGKTVLAAGDKVTLQLDNTGLASVSVSGSVVNALVENSGLLSATNGRVYLTARGKDMLLNTVVNNSGTIEAKGLNSRGGEIVLDGGDSGVVSQSGRLLADSAAGRGGKITVEGENIHLAANSRTSATGRTGGGEVYVGGGWQGKDSRIHNASKVVMDRTASVDVSATENGNGGTAVLWSEDYTNFRGTILAKGGSRSGNGGQVETSSHNNLQAYGDADASAPAGKGGNWLLDPLSISVGKNANVTESPAGVFTSSAVSPSVSNSSIQKQLDKGTNVTIKTGTGIGDGNITVNADIKKTGNNEASLTLDADGSIAIGDGKSPVTISSTTNKMDVNLYGAGSKDGNITLTNAKIENNGGNIVLGRKDEGTDHSLNIVSNNAVLNATIGKRVDTNAGNIILTAKNRADAPAVNLASSVFKGNNITINGTTNTGGSGVKLTSNHLKAGGDLNITGVRISGGSQYDNAGYGVNVVHVENNDNNFKAGKNINIKATSADGGDGALNLGGGTFNAANTFLSGTSTQYGMGIGVKVGAIIKVETGNLTLTGSAGWGASRGEAGIGNRALLGTEIREGATLDVAGNLTTNGTLGVYTLEDNTTKIKSGGDLNITADSGDILFKSTSTKTESPDNPGGNLNIEVGKSVNIQAKAGRVEINTSRGKQDVTIKSGTNGAGEGGGVSLGGNALDNSIGLLLSDVTIESGGDVSLAGQTVSGNKTALKVVSSHITSTKNEGKISLDGKTTGDNGDASGVRVEKSTFSAQSFDVKGVAEKKGTGFTLTDSTFDEGTKLTVSSAGSAANVKNILGKGIVTEQNRESFLTNKPGNLTTVDMGGTAIFDDASKGLVADFTSPDTNGGFIFSNTAVKAGGPVNLQGVDFNDSTIAVNNGGFSLSNKGKVKLDGGSITASGDIDLKSTDDGIVVKGTKISSDEGDVSLAASRQSVISDNAKIVSAKGNTSVSVDSGSDTVKGNLLTVRSAELKAKKTLHVSLNGDITGEYNGHLLSDQPGGTDTVNTWAGQEINIDISGAGNGAQIYGENDFDGNLTFISNSSAPGNADGSVFLGGNNRSAVNVTGNARFESTTSDETREGVPALNLSGKVNVGGSLYLKGSAGNGDGVKTSGELLKSGGPLTIEGDSVGGNGVVVTPGSAESTDGRVVIAGKSGSGNGVLVQEGANLAAEVNGESESGTGVLVKSGGQDKKTIMKNSKVFGTSNSGDGISVEGGNLDINGSSLNGTSNGDGNGVSLGEGGTIVGGTVKAHSVRGTGFKAGSGSTLDGVSVKGTTADGVGVDVSDLKDRKGGTTITGEATGHGTSVQTEHDDGSRPDVVPPAPGGDTGKPATPDTTPPAGGDTDKHDSSAPELKPGTAEAVRQYIYEKQGVLSQPERLMNTVRVSGLRERSEPVNVEICTEGQCRQLDVGTVNGPARP